MAAPAPASRTSRRRRSGTDQPHVTSRMPLPRPAAASPGSCVPHPHPLPPPADFCALPSNMFEGGHCGRCVRVCGADSCVVVSSCTHSAAGAAAACAADVRLLSTTAALLLSSSVCGLVMCGCRSSACKCRPPSYHTHAANPTIALASKFAGQGGGRLRLLRLRRH